MAGLWVRWSVQIGVICGGFAICLGLLVIIGWIVRADALIQVVPGFAPMQFNTALGFTISGIALILYSVRRPTAAARISYFSSFLGLFTLLQYLFDVDFGIDNFFIAPYLTDNTSHPGRMAPNTALCFMLFANAVAAEHTRKIIGRKQNTLYFAEFLSTLVMALALMSLFGYYFQNDEAIAWANLTGMALHTTVGFIVIGTGLSFVLWSQQDDAAVRTGFWVSAVLLIGVLALDISKPIEVTAGLAYIPLVFCSYFFKDSKATFVIAWLATVLIFIGYFTSITRPDLETYEIINRVLSVVTIWIIAVTIYFRNLSEQKLLASRVELATLREVEQFAQIASHDLRAPLRAIDNLTQWLEADLKDVLSGETKSNMDLLRGRVKRLDKLLDDILQFSRAGRDNPNLTKIKLDNFLANIGELVYLPDGFRINVSGPMPEVMAPEGVLEQIFGNLINNAVKHHDQKTGLIEISVKEEKFGWTFTVADDGPGIPPEYRSTIFDMFQKLEARDKTEGSGMGLSIVRKLVRRQGGDIWVDEESTGRGAIFYFTWMRR